MPLWSRKSRDQLQDVGMDEGCEVQYLAEWAQSMHMVLKKQVLANPGKTTSREQRASRLFHNSDVALILIEVSRHPTWRPNHEARPCKHAVLLKLVEECKCTHLECTNIDARQEYRWQPRPTQGPDAVQKRSVMAIMWVWGLTCTMASTLAIPFLILWRLARTPSGACLIKAIPTISNDRLQNFEQNFGWKVLKEAYKVSKR